MKTRIFHPKNPHSSLPFSAAVKSGNLLFVSGQGPLDIATKKVIQGTIEEETILTIKNIEEILQAAGSSLNDIVRCTCYLADLDDFDAFHHTYSRFFSMDVPPARTTVQAKLLRGIKIEIDAIAQIST